MQKWYSILKSCNQDEVSGLAMMLNSLNCHMDKFEQLPGVNHTIRSGTSTLNPNDNHEGETGNSSLSSSSQCADSATQITAHCHKVEE